MSPAAAKTAEKSVAVKSSGTKAGGAKTAKTKPKEAEAAAAPEILMMAAASGEPLSVAKGKTKAAAKNSSFLKPIFQFEVISCVNFCYGL